MHEPPISVVVCTRDRAELLRGCLESLASLDYPICEVIVVDNAPCDDSTRALVAATPFRYVREDRPGLDWARNCGMLTARYAIIAYIDDDARASPGWLRGIAAGFVDPHVAVVTGRVLAAALHTDAQVLFERYSGMDKGEQPQRFQRDQLRPRDLIAAHTLGVGANMAFRRTTLACVGPFDTALDVGTPAGGAGDLDMFHRVLVAGMLVHYEPTALVYHQHRYEAEALQRQIAANGRGFGVYLLKIWHQRSVSRSSLLRFALGWISVWLLARLFVAALGLLNVPFALVWAEVRGALDAPQTYNATYAHDRQVRELAAPPL
jgi:glycosyltransferase involved in cell wall biosynthesis